MRCENCGHDLPVIAKFCSKCGKKIVLYEQKRETKPDLQNERASYVSTVLSTIGLGIIGLVTGYLIFGQHQGDLIPIDELFVSGLKGKLYDLFGRQHILRNIFISGGIGAFLGLILGNIFKDKDTAVLLGGMKNYADSLIKKTDPIIEKTMPGNSKSDVEKKDPSLSSALSTDQPMLKKNQSMNTSIAIQEKIVIQLERLAQLKNKGFLTEEEFNFKKTEILNIE